MTFSVPSPSSRPLLDFAGLVRKDGAFTKIQAPNFENSERKEKLNWVLFRPSFLSVKNSCVFVLCDLVKTD